MRPLTSATGMISALWRFRHFILTSIRSEFQGRFARSGLGALWHILNPLAQAAILSLILSQVMGIRLAGVQDPAAYPIHLMAGTAAWGLFAEIFNRCVTVFITYAGSLKKISFPRLCLPMIVWGSALMNHLLLLAAIGAVFLLLGHPPNAAWAALPLSIILISMFAFGLGLVLGIINVFARDVAEVTGILMQIWFWLTPIVYSVDAVPARFRWFVSLNPMAPLVVAYQDAMLSGNWPDLASLWPTALVAVVLVGFAFILFRRASAELVDAL